MISRKPKSMLTTHNPLTEFPKCLSQLIFNSDATSQPDYWVLLSVYANFLHKAAKTACEFASNCEFRNSFGSTITSLKLL